MPPKSIVRIMRQKKTSEKPPTEANRKLSGG